ncbi:GNAT family N-acetyltransferase [Roseovarius aestuariivivens]|uniref:GNAT family N-acetyltransferase n=1 Tax=Roseovarius aestuariivivens TaxID=1888910 RepID=UPI00107FEAE9|nr:GNAT family protein [Roseovarius aestuariivivens]
MTEEVFGSAAQQALLIRGHACFRILRDDPRFSYYGRAVGLAAPERDTLGLVTALTRLQGVGSIARIPDQDMPSLRAQLEDEGLSVTHYARWSGGAAAIRAARAWCRDVPLPDDLTLHRIDADSPPDTLEKLAEVSLACGVLPITGPVLRGITRPGTGFVAVDAAGVPVASAGAAAYLHPDRDGGECWWGMLSTDPTRRGQRLALRVGAEVLLDITQRFGFTRVFTGIEPGNAASEAVCARMGLVREDASVLSTADPGQMPGGRMTK